MPIDFKQLRDRSRQDREERLAAMPPEQAAAERRRVELLLQAEAEAAATEAPITAVFERLEHEAPAPVRRPMIGLRPLGAPKIMPPPQDGARKTIVASTRTKDIRVRVEGRPSGDAPGREILRFVGGPTGWESYGLDAAFVASLLAWAQDRPRYYICAGTAGSYDACHVASDDVLAYLRERRPELFPEAAPTAPAPGR